VVGKLKSVSLPFVTSFRFAQQGGLERHSLAPCQRSIPLIPLAVGFLNCVTGLAQLQPTAPVLLTRDEVFIGASQRCMSGSGDAWGLYSVLGVERTAAQSTIKKVGDKTNRRSSVHMLPQCHHLLLDTSRPIICFWPLCLPSSILWRNRGVAFI
jgi:hypothetical protein